MKWKYISKFLTDLFEKVYNEEKLKEFFVLMKIIVEELSFEEQLGRLKKDLKFFFEKQLSKKILSLDEKEMFHMKEFVKFHFCFTKILKILKKILLIENDTNFFDFFLFVEEKFENYFVEKNIEQLINFFLNSLFFNKNFLQIYKNFFGAKYLKKYLNSFKEKFQNADLKFEKEILEYILINLEFEEEENLFFVGNENIVQINKKRKRN